jgi:hypothetical protein
MRWDRLVLKVKSYFRKEKTSHIPLTKEAGKTQEVFLEGVTMDRAEDIRQTVLLSPWSIAGEHPKVRASTESKSGLMISFKAIGTQGSENIKRALVEKFRKQDA